MNSNHIVEKYLHIFVTSNTFCFIYQKRLSNWYSESNQNVAYSKIPRQATRPHIYRNIFNSTDGLNSIHPTSYISSSK